MIKIVLKGFQHFSVYKYYSNGKYNFSFHLNYLVNIISSQILPKAINPNLYKTVS